VKSVVSFAVCLAVVPIPLAAQEARSDTTPPEHAGHQALNLFNGAGLSIGNSARWTGLRLNFRDHAVERVNGVNLTIWPATANSKMVMNGLALGVTGPVGGRFSGATVGLLGAVAEHGFAGLTVAGLGAVSNGSMAGINLAGLGLVASRDLHGISVGGLAVVGNGSAAGVTLSSLAVVADGGAYGVSAAGLAIVADGGLYGVGLGGLAVVATGPLVGVGASVGAVVADPGVRGFALAGYHVEGAHWIRGFAGSVIWNRAVDLTGVAVGGYNCINGEQHGLTIGLYNYARSLHGVQLGLLNNARNNKGIWRVLPLLNVHLH